MSYKKNQLCFLLIIFFIILNFTIFAENDCGCEGSFTFPPPDFSLWPASNFKTEMTNQQGTIKVINYYKKNRIKQEIKHENDYTVRIYRFNKDNVDFVILYPDDEKFNQEILSYQDYTCREEYHLSLLYKTLPGEELGFPYFKKGEEKYLKRDVISWEMSGSLEDKDIEMVELVDPELRLVLKSSYNNKVNFMVTKIEFIEFPDSIYQIPESYTLK